MPYDQAKGYLAQGDVFSLELVAPVADDEIRVLRTESGLHGEHVLMGEPGKIFDYNSLKETVAGLPAAQQCPPFESTDGVPLEYVVVFGDLVEYFIIASQTCDVSGVDSEPKHLAAVMPVISLGAYLSRQRLPIGLAEADKDDESKWMTIADCVQGKLGEELGAIRQDVFALPDKIRTLVKKWDPPKKAEEDKQLRRKILDTLNDVASPRKNYIYYLPANRGHGIPEAFIDFTRLYSVVTAKLADRRKYRVCTLASPYKEDFASKLGTYLSRIATPAPLLPPKV